MVIALWIIGWFLATYLLAIGLHKYLSRPPLGLFDGFFIIIQVYGFIIISLAIGMVVIGTKVIGFW